MKTMEKKAEQMQTEYGYGGNIMNKNRQILLDHASAIAKCEECNSFYTCDNMYSDNNIFRCAIDKLLNEMMKNG